MNATELKERYAHLEARYGEDAPVALLIECRYAENSQNPMCQLLAQDLGQLLVQREIDLFKATKRQQEEPQDPATITARFATHAAQIVALTVFSFNLPGQVDA
jgi:hypothetical protein